MVDVEKLNKTINKLDEETKKIDSVLEMQSKFDATTKQLENIHAMIKQEKLDVDVIKNESQRVLDASSTVVDTVTTKVDDKFEELKKQVEQLIANFSNVEDTLKGIEGEVAKQLTETRAENYKMINEFQQVLDAKNNLLKSDLQLEVRDIRGNIDESLKGQKETIQQATNKQELEFKTQEENLKKLQNDMEAKFNEAEKKNRICLVIIAVLIVGNIVLSVIR